MASRSLTISRRPLIILTFITGISLVFWAWMARGYALPHTPCALAVVTLIAGHVILEVRRSLDLNRPRPDAPPYPTLGLANTITAARGIVLAFLAGFLCIGLPTSPVRWIPGILYSLNTVADFADGLVARLTRHPSLLGKHLDMHLDGLGVLLAALLVVRFGHMPWWYALVGLARYIFLAGEMLLKMWGHPVYPLSPSPTRRVLSGMQMTFLAVALYPWPTMAFLRWTGTILFVPFILGFIRDFFIVAGWRWFAESPWFTLDFCRRHLLPLVRWGTGGLLLGYTWYMYPVLSAHMPPAVVLAHALLGIFLVGGIIARVDAMLVLVMMAIHLSIMPEHIWHVLLLAGGTAVLLWGGGHYSLWTPDETLFLKRLGA